jgi:hypothetical protein
VVVDKALEHFDNAVSKPDEPQAGSVNPTPVAQLTWNDPRVRLPRIKTGLISEDVLIAMADDAGRFTYRSACAVYYTIPQRGVTISHWVVGTPNGLDSTIGAHAVGGWAYFNPYFADTDALPLIDK